MNDFFRNEGGYLYHVKLEGTMDSHSRRVFVDGECVGTLLFHNWDFRLEPETNVTFKLRWWPQIMNEINRDTSIEYQRKEDHRKTMAANARRALTEANIPHNALTDREAVEAYLNMPAPLKG